MKDYLLNINKEKILTSGAILSIIMVFLFLVIEAGNSGNIQTEALQASKYMRESISEISNWCIENNININEDIDPWKTGLVGSEISDITTTLGSLEAKRTTLNPEFASLITKLLFEAGISNGDTIAVSCSGSFPGLLIASLSAMKAMGIYGRIILSLGSSSYGANNPGFTILDIYEFLVSNGLTGKNELAVSLGGGNDVGEGFEKGMADRFKSKIIYSGIPFIYESDLTTNISRRESFYFDDDINIKAFINSGGSYPAMGISPLILKVNPGRVGKVAMPDVKERGLVFTMLDHDIPVIHLLNIKGLCQTYDIRWDVSPFEIAESEFEISVDTPRANLLFSSLFMIFFTFFMIFYNRLYSMHE